MKKQIVLPLFLIMVLSPQLPGGVIEIVEQSLYVSDGLGGVRLTPNYPGYFAALNPQNEGTFGWTYTNTTAGILTDVRVFGFLDADIDRPLNTFFNEYGTLVKLALPPDAPLRAISASSWQIDEPGFVFGTIVADLQRGVLLNRNFVPISAPDDVSLALGFTTGALSPNQSITAVFRISRAPIGGLQQTDPDSKDGFFFNGYAVLGPANSTSPEPGTFLLAGISIMALYTYRRAGRH